MLLTSDLNAADSDRSCAHVIVPGPTSRENEMKKVVLALSAVSLLAGSMPALAAAPCKDAKGKFTKCPQKKAAAAKPKQCRDAKGHYAKCK